MIEKELYKKRCLDFYQCEDCPFCDIKMLCEMLLTENCNNVGEVLKKFNDAYEKINELKEK